MDYGKWIHIKEKMVSDIIKGVYKPYTTVKNENGEKIQIPASLPSIAEIAKIYGCGKSTAQKVLNEMCNNGILIRKNGVGYFIKPLVKDKLRNEQIREIKKELERITYNAKELGIIMKDFQEMYAVCLEAIYLS